MKSIKQRVKIGEQSSEISMIIYEGERRGFLKVLLRGECHEREEEI